MFKSGLGTPWGIGFWGANGHDGIWHIALIESIVQGRFDMPTFAGSKLQNYHIGFDLFIALVNKITNIPVSVLYFQIMPLTFALLIGILTYKFVLLWKKKTSEALFAVFFVYFGGSFGWLVTLARNQGLGGESLFWSQQAVSTLINPPFALSLIFILVGLISLQKFTQKKSRTAAIVTALMLGLVISVKAYAGVLLLSSLCVVTLYECSIKRSFRLLPITLLSLLIAFFVFVPFNKSSGNLLVFQPFWFLETLLGLSDRFYWPKLYEALLNWKLGNVYHKELLGYAVAFGIFICGNFGSRLIFVRIFFNYKRIEVSVIDIILITTALMGIVIPMVFLQSGTPWNTIQFFYYTLFVLSIYAGLTFEKYAKNKMVLVILILITLPTSISTLNSVYLPARPPAKLSVNEQEALSFLRSQASGVVLTYLFDAYKAKEAEVDPPRPLYRYESTAYVSAFSAKPTFLEDEVNLQISGYPFADRKQKIESFYKESDQSKARQFLRDNSIRYIYWIKGQRALLGESQLGLERIFENSEVDIYRVQ